MFKFFILLAVFAYLPSQAGANFPSFEFAGDGHDGDFVYNGEGAGCDTALVCQNGTCSGTAPNGKCIVSSGDGILSSFIFYIKDSPYVQNAGYLKNYSNFTLTAGTLQFDPATLGDFGQADFIFVKNNATFTGGTIDLKGMGSIGASGGTDPVCSNAGLQGGSTGYATGGAGGTTIGAFGESGMEGVVPGGSLTNLGDWQIFRFGFHVGAGGGTNTLGITQRLPVNTRGIFGLPSWGASGGGGGYCNAACSGTVGPGGRGGGALLMEVGGILVTTIDAHVDIRGNDGGVGGGAGGGGGLFHVLYRDANPYLPLIDPLTSGGAADLASVTNCVHGGPGGSGVWGYHRLAY